MFVLTVHQIAFGKQKCNFTYKCLSPRQLRILHLAFGGIVWPALVWNHKAPPPRHTHTLAERGIGPVRSGWSSYRPLSLSFGTLHLNNTNTKGRQKNRIFHNCGGLGCALPAALIVSFVKAVYLQDTIKFTTIYRILMSKQAVFFRGG